MQSLGKHCGKEVKLLKMSNFTFFHNVFYAICIIKSFNRLISVVVCSFFEFGKVSKWCIREWGKVWISMCRLLWNKNVYTVLLLMSMYKWDEKHWCRVNTFPHYQLCILCSRIDRSGAYSFCRLCLLLPFICPQKTVALAITWMVNDRAFIFHMCIPWGMTFSWVSSSRSSVSQISKLKFRRHGCCQGICS